MRVIATRYMVTFNSGVASGKDYPRAMLNEILGRVFGLLRRKRTSIPRAAERRGTIIYDKGYDYIEMMDTSSLSR